MKNLLILKSLIISLTLVGGLNALAQGAPKIYKIQESIPVQTGTEVVWRNWKGEYENHLVDKSFFPNNMARAMYLQACADTAKMSQLCDSYYRDRLLNKYVYVSTPGTCAERPDGLSTVCVGDLVKSLHGPMQARVVGISSGVHYNSKTGAFGRFVMTQDLEHPASTEVDSQSINEVWVLNR